MAVLRKANLPQLQGGLKLDGADVDPNISEVFEYSYEFLGNAGDTLPIPWGTYESTANADQDYGDGVCGSYFIANDSTSEAQNTALYWRDALLLGVWPMVAEFRVKILADDAGAQLLGASDALVIGLASARNATLDSVANHVWLRIQGANKNILIESDDGTTDTDDKDTGLDYVHDQYFKVRFEIGADKLVNVFIDLEDGNGYRRANNGNTFSLVALNAGLQPIIELQRASGALENRVEIDYFRARTTRQ